jgi:hypothetical protein
VPRLDHVKGVRTEGQLEIGRTGRQLLPEFDGAVDVNVHDRIFSL